MSITKWQRFKVYFLYFQTFPSELTMWIDPLEVSYRIGENGSICVLYEHKGSKKEESTDPQQPEAWRPTTSNSTSSTANVVVSKASGPGSGNTAVDNGHQQRRTPSPLSSPIKLKTTQPPQTTTSSSSFSSPSSPFHNNQLNNHHHNNYQSQQQR